MAFHVPFEHRNKPQGPKPRPMYIGFDRPRRRPAKPRNLWALFGFLTTFLSVGLLSPIGLLMSLIGLRRSPRSLAKVGTTLSLLGTLIMGGIFGTAYYAHHHDHQMEMNRHHERRVAVQVDKTKELMAEAAVELDEYKETHKGMLPTEIECNMLMLKHLDPWGKELRFDVQNSDYALIRSAGSDGQYDTGDDVTRRVEGETEYEILLPVE